MVSLNIFFVRNDLVRVICFIFFLVVLSLELAFSCEYGQEFNFSFGAVDQENNEEFLEIDKKNLVLKHNDHVKPGID